MSYLVLARKWRPRRFQELVGQGHVSKTLMNSIKAGRIAHGFLFAGARGVGKTTTARIFSMALNCSSYKQPTPEPCGSCEVCVKIMNSSCVDVHEIDGASNNSVDDVRELRETAPYKPVSCRFKVYIIDEVHMLSTSAFNALLKTLEEPPPHVKFVFATTEPHRIPVTILSRCQRFDFRKISSSLIADKIIEICKSEEVEIEKEAALLLAREADGSMRDALSALDQMISAFGSSVTLRDVVELFGFAGPELHFQLSEALMRKDASGCLGILGRLNAEGYNTLRFMENYLNHVRDMIVVKVAGGENYAGDATHHEVERVEEMVKNVEVGELFRIFTTLSSALDTAHYSPNPAIVFDVAFMKLCSAPPLVSIEKVLQRLGELKKAGVALSSNPSFSLSAGTGLEEMGGRRGDFEVKTDSAQEGIDRMGGSATRSIYEEKDDRWGVILKDVSKSHPRLAQILSLGVIVEFSEKKLVIGFPAEGFGCSFVKQKSNLEVIKEAVRGNLGFSPEVIIEEKSAVAVKRKLEWEGKRRKKRESVEQEVRDHPVIKESLRVLGGEIIDIKTDVD